MTIRVLIADDQELVRAGLRAVFAVEPDIEVVAEAGDGRAAVDVAREHHPDVVLMDVRMPRMDGLLATKELLAGLSPPKVLILTTFDLDDYVYGALRAGASGFLLKDSPVEQLVSAVRVVDEGHALLAPTTTRRLIETVVAGPAAVTPPPGFDELTPREREVLLLVAEGRSNAEIAETLFLGPATVKTHVSRVLMKLRLRDRIHAVIAAYEGGLVSRGDRPPPPL